MVGNASWACDFFKIGSGNQSADPGTDFIYENPKAVPAAAGSTGSKGCLRWDADNLYLATNTDTWRTIPLQVFGIGVQSVPTLHVYDQSTPTTSWIQLPDGNNVVVAGNAGSGVKIPRATDFEFQPTLVRETGSKYKITRWLNLR